MPYNHGLQQVKKTGTRVTRKYSRAHGCLGDDKRGREIVLELLRYRKNESFGRKSEDLTLCEFSIGARHRVIMRGYDLDCTILMRGNNIETIFIIERLW